MTEDLRIIQHAENVWSYRHDWTRVEPAIGLVLSDKGWIVIDGGSSPVHGDAVYRAMQEIADVPVHILIATHRHFDHTFGNQSYRARVLSGKRCKERYDANMSDDWGPDRVQDWLAKDMLPHIPNLSENDFSELQLVPIDDTFDDQLNTSIGGVKLELFHLPGVHTDDSAAVYVPEAKVIFLGDAFYLLEGPEGQITNLPGLLDRVAQCEIEQYVPGHERPHDHAVFERLRVYCEEILSEAEQRIGNGAGREAVMSIPLRDRYLVDKTSFVGERMHSRMLRDAYRQLASAHG